MNLSAHLCHKIFPIIESAAGEVNTPAYVVGGFRASAQATDVDWLQSRSPAFYYVDNNSRPSAGVISSAGLTASVPVLIKTPC